MSVSRRRFITISAGLALGAIVSPAGAKTVSWHGVALGAEAKLIITGLPKGEANRLVDLALAEIDRLERIFSLYRTDSKLCELNRDGKLQVPPPELLSLFSKVDVIYRATGGLFDPTVQPLWRVYAEHAGKPSDNAIRQARRRVGWQHVGYDTAVVQFARPHMQLTLNGIAQGFVTDRIASLLKSEGVKHAVVNIGEISALGNKSDGEPWQVRLTSGGNDLTDEFVQLSNQAVATSAPMGTTFDGRKSHILNPLSGLPSAPYWKRVSVIDGSATIADGLSTASVLMAEAAIHKSLKTVTGSTLIARRSDNEVLRLQSEVI